LSKSPEKSLEDCVGGDLTVKMFEPWRVRGADIPRGVAKNNAEAVDFYEGMDREGLEGRMLTGWMACT
jgi:hypothetical protein